MTDGENHGNRGEERRQAAVLVALRTGLLRRCPVHGEVYDPGQHDYQGACMTATYLVNRDDPLVAPFLGDRAALTAILKLICRGYETACARCSGRGDGRESERE
jgi:hypothetical protein